MMQGNDIGTFVSGSYAVMFEGLAYTEDPDVAEVKTGLFRRTPTPAPVRPDLYIRRLKARDLPMKSLLHLIHQLGKRVDVFTYYDSDYVEHIEHWLARKNAPCTVYSYEDLPALYDDFKYNRDVQTLFTPFEDDAALLGMRATVMSVDGTWGI